MVEVGLHEWLRSSLTAAKEFVRDIICDEDSKCGKELDQKGDSVQPHFSLTRGSSQFTTDPVPWEWWHFISHSFRALLVLTLNFPSPQPEELTNILEISNVVFTSMFALEMILKLAAFGLFDYLRNPYNIFDSIIVIIR